MYNSKYMDDTPDDRDTYYEMPGSKLTDRFRYCQATEGTDGLGNIPDHDDDLKSMNKISSFPFHNF